MSVNVDTAKLAPGVVVALTSIDTFDPEDGSEMGPASGTATLIERWDDMWMIEFAPLPCVNTEHDEINCEITDVDPCASCRMLNTAIVSELDLWQQVNPKAYGRMLAHSRQHIQRLQDAGAFAPGDPF